MDPIMLLVIIGGAFFAWKSGILNNITGGGNQVSVSQGGETAYAGPGGPEIDVAGNGCACSNGKCIGNCSGNMTATNDLGGMSPKEWVNSKVPGAFNARKSYYGGFYRYYPFWYGPGYFHYYYGPRYPAYWYAPWFHRYLPRRTTWGYWW